MRFLLTGRCIELEGVLLQKSEGGLPVKRTEHPWAGHEEFALQVAIVVNCRAAQVSYVLSDHRSIPVASTGELHACMRCVKHACRARTAGHDHISASRVLNLEHRRIEARIGDGAASEIDRCRHAGTCEI